MMLETYGRCTYTTVMRLAHELTGTRSERLKEAWRRVKDVCNILNPEHGPLLDADICPACHTIGWIIPNEQSYECMNCGAHFLPITRQDYLDYVKEYGED